MHIRPSLQAVSPRQSGNQRLAASTLLSAGEVAPGIVHVDFSLLWYLVAVWESGAQESLSSALTAKSHSAHSHSDS